MSGVFYRECYITSIPQFDIDPFVTHDDRAAGDPHECEECKKLNEQLTMLIGNGR